jgi:hypothetical protein
VCMCWRTAVCAALCMFPAVIVCSASGGRRGDVAHAVLHVHTR